ncbi:monovalent cation/H(+) antiporter subunit G [Xanthobacter sp. V0B-10]|uniref:cation:proton antiporter n=1 Tax=Xanthobacter albus TaxID=3119929 RepID=UPI00372B97D1
MSLARDIFTLLLVAAGLLFFIAGTVGLLRLPDPLARLHALSKADNIGLGLIVLGLLPQAVAQGGVLDAAKMLGIWLLLQVSSGAVAQLMADVAFRAGPERDAPDERGEGSAP